jgi:hypothetical protein
MPSSGMLCHVALVRANISEERINSIIRVTRIGKLGTMLAVTSTLATWCNISEDGILHCCLLYRYISNGVKSSLLCRKAKEWKRQYKHLCDIFFNCEVKQSEV